MSLARRSEEGVRHGARARRIIVVGAGVSGCACAATLTEAGASVTLMNPSLDHVGEPCFGSLLAGLGVGEHGAREVLERLPAGLREAWWGSALVTRDGSFMTVDRRMVSIETKRALEHMPGLEFRQGLVTGLGLVGVGVDVPDGAQGMMRVQTAFGEELVADAVVVAVGLSLGGTARVGEAVAGGGRYGEPASEGLRVALEELGAKLASRRAEVGPGFEGGGSYAMHGWPAGWLAGSLAGGDGASVGELVGVALERVSEHAGVRTEGYPPSPYCVEELWPKAAVASMASEGVVVPVFVPDGLATGEVVTVARHEIGGVSNGDAGEPVTREALVASRPRCLVEGLAVVNVCAGGRLESPSYRGVPVWITGRAGGSREYLDSLSAGVRTGEVLARFLGCADVRFG
jgi:hypothetical protein